MAHFAGLNVRTLVWLFRLLVCSFVFLLFFQFFLISQRLQSNNDNDRGINIFGAFLCRELVLTLDSEWSKNIVMSANINSIVIFSQVLHNLSMWTAKEKSLNYDQAKEEAAKAQKDIKMVISLSSTADKLVILSVWYNIPSRNLRSVPKRCSIVWSVICAQSSRQEIKKVLYV